LTNNAFTNFYPQTSSDGRYIFFASHRSGANQVWRMNADGSNQTQLTKSEGGYPRFVTPDGKWVYFQSGLHQTLWRVSTDSGEETQVSEEKIFEPAFSPNGNLLAFFFRVKGNDNRNQIAVMSVDSRKIVKTLNLAENRSTPVKIAWAGDNQILYYITTNGPKNSLWRQTFSGDGPRLISDFGDEEIGDFQVSPDGGSFAFIRGKWIHNAVLIEGLK